MSHIGTGVTIQMKDGKEYKVGRVDKAIRRQFAEWAAPQVPSPFEVLNAHMEKLPFEIKKELARDALKSSQRKLDFTHPAIVEFSQSDEGAHKLLELALKVNHPNITAKEVEEVFNRAAELGALEERRKERKQQGLLPETPEQEEQFLNPTLGQALESFPSPFAATNGNAPSVRLSTE